MNKKNKNKGLSLIELMVAIVIASLLSTTAYFTYQTQTLKTQIAEVMAQSQNHLTHLVAQKQLRSINNLSYKIDNLESKILQDSEVKNGQLFLVLDPQKFDDQNLIVFKANDEANHFDCYTNIDKVNVSGCSNELEVDNAVENRDEYIDKLKQLLRDGHISEFDVHFGDKVDRDKDVRLQAFVDSNGFKELMVHNKNLDNLGIDMDGLEYLDGVDSWESYRVSERYGLIFDQFDMYINLEHHINSIINKLNSDELRQGGGVHINEETVFRNMGGDYGEGSGEKFREALKNKVEEIYSSVY